MIRCLMQLSMISVLATVTTASQAAFPDKPIKLIVPFGAGSSVDAVGRQFGNALTEVVKQPVVIDNRAGAEGAIGAQAVIASPPDGYTMLMTSSSLPVLAPLMTKGLSFDPVKDFVPVCTLSRISNVMNMRSSLPFKTAGEFIAAAKAAPEKYTFGYSTATTRLGGELFQQETGIKLLGVPYKTSVAGLADLAADRIDVFFIDHVSATPFYQSGKVKALAVTGSQRVNALPGVLTMVESGIPTFELQPWFAVYVPVRTPTAVVTQLREATRKALEVPAWLEWLSKNGFEKFAVCGDDLSKLQSSEMERWGGVIKKANIQPQ